MTWRHVTESSLPEGVLPEGLLLPRRILALAVVLCSRYVKVQKYSQCWP